MVRVTQLFSPTADLVLRLAILALLGGVATLTLVGFGLVRSGQATNEDRSVEQPVPFSHQHHVGGLGIDCRYCHASVETSSFAGIPPTDTCMNCHRELWTEAPALAPVRESWRTGERLRWNRVHDLADFVYFDHSIHVRAGVGCVSCHGRVDTMPLMRQAAPLTMQWCLDCHRDPGPNLRPREAVFDPAWTPPPGEDDGARGRRLIAEHGIDAARLTHCTVCHR
jgi:hypothetical protein